MDGIMSMHGDVKYEEWSPTFVLDVPASFSGRDKALHYYIRFDIQSFIIMILLGFHTIDIKIL